MLAEDEVFLHFNDTKKVMQVNKTCTEMSCIKPKQVNPSVAWKDVFGGSEEETAPNKAVASS